MLSIRFVRIGKKKYPIYRIVVMEKGKNPKSSYLENLGTYNPHTKENNIKKDRAEYWLEKGAGLTATVHNLFAGQGIIKDAKIRASKTKPGKKKQKEIDLKKAEEEAALKAQAAEKAAAEEAAKIAAETPAETAPEAEATPETSAEEVKAE